MLLLRYLPVLNDQSEVEFSLIPTSAHAWLSKAPSKALVDFPDPSTHVHGTMQTRPLSIPISFTYHPSHFPNSHIYHITTNPFLITLHIPHTQHISAHFSHQFRHIHGSLSCTHFLSLNLLIPISCTLQSPPSFFHLVYL